ncbi:hypothetical protein HK407_06g11090 [Ordospora pajunii]|uniref:uncharacterized protein n=1 Tax=Ordospora pajunii TaxID=3039483 RepID=UPI00295269D7|nr:uncharacterized protein HK407_06g11090 [Ordospora pajunii]KAH9411279.1 hypothetical protein HK407_06g11090 [Ordospora pajunii]
MERISIDEIARKASFVVRERSAAHGMQMPKEFSRVCSVHGHRAVVYGTTLFIDDVKAEEDVVYLSKDGERVVATKKKEVIVYDFLKREEMRIDTVKEVKRCEVWNEWIGMLTEEGILYVYKNGEFACEYDDVKDFVLPDVVVRSDRKLMGHEEVQRVFRDHDGQVIVVCVDKLACGKNEVANGISTGDIEYDREWNECHYYHCDFHGVNIVSSSKSSKILLLGTDLCEVDMDEEIRLLGLRTNEMLDVKYLAGIDYSAGWVDMVDEDGVLSTFEVVGIDCGKMDGCTVPADGVHAMEKFVERKYKLCKETGMQKADASDAIISGSLANNGVNSACMEADAGNDGMISISDMMSAVCDIKDTVQEHGAFTGDNAVEVNMKVKSESKNECQTKSTGDSKIDRLLESLSAQVDMVIEDFRNICVEKRIFKMYKYNANDLSLFTEQVYKNIMRLEEYKSMQQQISEKLSQMQGSLEVYEGMDEENIKSAVKYIDSVIDSMGAREGRKIVHYAKPLLHTISNAKAMRLELDVNAIKIGKGLNDVEYAESRMQEMPMSISVNRQIDAEQSMKYTAHQNASEPAHMPKECINTVDEAKPDTQANCLNQRLKEDGNAHGQADAANQGLKNGISTAYEPPGMQKPLANAMIHQHTNIFGQPVSQQQETVQFGMIGNAMPSSIFESLASNATSIPVSSIKNEEEPNEDVPNAFLRFANTRNLF